MIAVLAGRRIDAASAGTPRFPLQNVAPVRERIKDALAGVSALVCSAACGADLIALEEAGKLHLRRRVVLPFEPAEFRKTSVVDRPGDWGAVFDKILDEVEARGDLVLLPYNSNADDAYAAANAAILEEAQRIAVQSSQDIFAIVVWDGKPRGSDDLTAAFDEAAKRNGYAISEISTV